MPTVPSFRYEGKREKERREERELMKKERAEENEILLESRY